MTNLKKSGAQHYMKWNLTPDLSLRFYFCFQDRREYENKYFLKTHSNKQYQLIESDIIIQELIKTSFSVQEIFGRRTKTGYTKFISEGDNLDSLTRFLENEQNQPIQFF